MIQMGKRTPTLQSSLRKLFAGLAIGYLATFFFLVFASILFSRLFCRELAQQIAPTVRQSILIGDFKQALLTIEAANRGYFEGVAFFLTDGTPVFITPPNAPAKSTERTWFRDTMDISIAFDQENRETAGILRFLFSPFRFIGFAVTAWLFTCVATLPFAWIAKRKVTQRYHAELEQRSKETLAQLAHQVAHDIRSPLTALSVIENHLSGISEDTRALLRDVITRIRDIANNLIEQNRVSATEGLPSEPMGTEWMWGTIETLVNEKRWQYRARNNIFIELKKDRSSEETSGSFARVQPTAFKRVLSNLIDNAVEAMQDGGHIVLTLGGAGDSLSLTIKDDGRGIPQSLLPRLMQRGATFGKKGGSGLGLYHARETIERWNGKIRIESEQGRGTTVTLTLPRSNEPD